MSFENFVSEFNNLFVEKALSNILFDLYDKHLYEIDDVIKIECNIEKTLKELKFKNNEFETFGKILSCNNYIQNMDKKHLIKEMNYENNKWLYHFNDNTIFDEKNNVLKVSHKYMDTIYINNDADKGT